VVERDHPQTGVNLTYIKQGSDPNANMDGGDQYTGLDRFGRVIDQNWYNTNTSTSTSTDRFQYGYDRDGNVLWRNNLVNTAFGELYTYDNLNQLTSFQRGTLNSTHTGLVGSASRSQGWTPDALGNFTGVTTNGSAQTRTANQQNEYTSISGSGTVSYDADGNTTADGSDNTYVYDAWDRLVQVKSGSTVLASYGYNGLGERVTEAHGSTTTDLYYSAGWQVLEERQGGQVQARDVWSPAGVDALVLRDQSSQHNGTLDQRLYAQQDADGNVTALVGTTGTVLERYAYDAYGAVTVMSPGWSTLGASDYGAIYLYQGKRLDGSVGLYDSRGRAISPSLMRPLQADPLGLGPDVNDYRWEGNGPVGASDPSGDLPPDRHRLQIGPLLDGHIPVYARYEQLNYWRAWETPNTLAEDFVGVLRAGAGPGGQDMVERNGYRVPLKDLERTVQTGGRPADWLVWFQKNASEYVGPGGNATPMGGPVQANKAADEFERNQRILWVASVILAGCQEYARRNTKRPLYMPSAEARSKRPGGGAKSLGEYNKHTEKLEAARQRLQALQEQLGQVKGPKRQAPIKKEIEQLEKAIKGHEKEIGQKWPGGPPSE
jgi:RHS repeat-associated protein